MAFRFRLDKVLRYRRRLVDLQSRSVAEAAAKVAELADLIARRRRDQHQAIAEGATAHDLHRRCRYTAWITHLEDEITALESSRLTAEENLAAERLSLQEAWREREVLEHLRLRRRAEWLEGVRRRERADLDEIGQQRALARSRQQRARRAEHLAAEPGTGTAGPDWTTCK